MQRYSDFLEHRTQYNEYGAQIASLSSPSNARTPRQRGEIDPSESDAGRGREALAGLASTPAATPAPNAVDSTIANRRVASDYVTSYLANRPSSDPGPTQTAGYVPAFAPPSRGVGGMFSNVRAGVKGLASSAYTVPQAFKSAAFGSDEETRMAAKKPGWTGAYGGAIGSSIRAYRVADEDLAQAEMRELESLKSSTRDRVFQSVLAFTIKELQKDSQARLKALTDKDMAARKANKIDIKMPKNDASADGYYDHNQWYYNDDVIILDEGWARDLYRHAASAGAGIGSFLKDVVPRTVRGFGGYDKEKVRGPYKDSKAYGGFMGSVQQARNAAQESLDMADIRAAESIVSRSSHPLVIKQLVSFIRAKKGLKGNEKSIATANAYLKKITNGKKTEWRTLAQMPKGPYDSGSINDIIAAQTGVDPAAGRTAAGGDAGRPAGALATIEKEKEKEELLNPIQKAQKAQKEKLEKQSGYPVLFEPQKNSQFGALDTNSPSFPSSLDDGKERASSVSTGSTYGGYSVGAGDPAAARSSAELSKRESRNYSRSLESIYNESFFDSIGKTVKAGYDYMTGSQKKQDEVPPKMNEKQRKIYHAMLDINKMSQNEYESMSEKNKEKAFRYAIDQVLNINGIPNMHWLVNMSDEKKLEAWERARRRFHGVFGPLTDKL
jgi:hypothetical protein